MPKTDVLDEKAETTAEPKTKTKKPPQAAKIEIPKKVLAAELKLALEATERGHTTIPILGTILLRAEPGELTLAATDLAIGYRAKVNATVTGSGAICLRAKNLGAIVPELPDAPVTIQLTDHGATLTCERCHFKLPGMSPENFPLIPEGKAETEFTLRASLLREEIRCVQYAISQEESRYTLNGALLVTANQKLLMVATDGHRMALIDAPLPDAAADFQILIQNDLLSFLYKLLGQAEADATITVRKDEQHLYFELGNRLIVGRQLTGQFPNYEAVLPKDLPNTTVIDAPLFLGALRRVALLTDERTKAVGLTLGSGQLKLSAANGEYGEATDELMVETHGEEAKIGFNSQYLLDFLSVAGTAKIRLEMKNENPAARLVTCPDPEDKSALNYQYVVMPMRC